MQKSCLTRIKLKLRPCHPSRHTKYEALWNQIWAWLVNAIPIWESICQSSMVNGVERCRQVKLCERLIVNWLDVREARWAHLSTSHHHIKARVLCGDESRRWRVVTSLVVKANSIRNVREIWGFSYELADDWLLPFLRFCYSFLLSPCLCFGDCGILFFVYPDIMHILIVFVRSWFWVICWSFVCSSCHFHSYNWCYHWWGY